MYEFNKIAGWVLAAMISVLGISILTSELIPSAKPENPGYIVEGVEEEGASAAVADAETPIAVFLANADMSRGETQFRKCAACHTVTKGGASGVGPNLWGINGAAHAHVASFSYSAAMQETSDRNWDWDSLSAWIKSPKKYIPGNKMSFAGIGKDQDRADLLVYLNAQSDSPQPLPEVPAEEEEVAEADSSDEVADEAAEDSDEEIAEEEVEV